MTEPCGTVSEKRHRLRCRQRATRDRATSERSSINPISHFGSTMKLPLVRGVPMLDFGVDRCREGLNRASDRWLYTSLADSVFRSGGE